MVSIEISPILEWAWAILQWAIDWVWIFCLLVMAWVLLNGLFRSADMVVKGKKPKGKVSRHKE